MREKTREKELAELGSGGGLFFLRSWCVTGPLMKLGRRDGDIKCLWQCPQGEAVKEQE